MLTSLYFSLLLFRLVYCPCADPATADKTTKITTAIVDFISLTD